jgi:hypothetical protein
MRVDHFLLRTERRPRILLKARPTPAQLAERMQPPVPDGVELYIHEDDVRPGDWLETLAARFAAHRAPEDFLWVVEGPVWSLDGELFGLCRGSAADRDLVRRLVRLAQHIGAPAINIHCVEGSPDPAVLSEQQRDDTLDRALPFLGWYVRTCRGAGLVPLIENVPPICRMRRAAFIYTPIGVLPGDLIACVTRVPGLGLTLDTSHAQLAVNAFRGAEAPGDVVGDTRDALHAAARYYRQQGGPATLHDYVEPLLPWIVGAHVSNAAGLLDEGLPYERGDADLDAAVRQLATRARYLVTEPLDTDEDYPIHKRAMQLRLGRALAATPAGAAR